MTATGWLKRSDFIHQQSKHTVKSIEEERIKQTLTPGETAVGLGMELPSIVIH